VLGVGGRQKAEDLKPQPRTIHFFNEPERAGISPEKAAKIWIDQVVPLRTSYHKRLVSPSCASDPAGIACISRWMNLVANCWPPLVWHQRRRDDQISRNHAQRTSTSTHHCLRMGHYLPKLFGLTVQLANWMDNTPLGRRICAFRVHETDG
jgi:hypothetical protein